jgi:hypothetical protein
MTLPAMGGLGIKIRSRHVFKIQGLASLGGNFITPRIIVLGKIGSFLYAVKEKGAV